MSRQVNTPNVHGEIKTHGLSRGQVVFTGQIRDHVKDGKLTYAAAAPADRRASYSGSGLPFFNAAQAFEHTPNIGTVSTDAGGRFVITLTMPNAYYIGLGSTYVPPTIYLTWNNGQTSVDRSVQLAEGIPYRKLTYPWQRVDASFYGSMWSLPVRSQEQVFRDSVYPQQQQQQQHEDDHFWGLRPPV